MTVWSSGTSLYPPTLFPMSTVSLFLLIYVPNNRELLKDASSSKFEAYWLNLASGSDYLMSPRGSSFGPKAMLPWLAYLIKLDWSSMSSLTITVSCLFNPYFSAFFSISSSSLSSSLNIIVFWASVYPAYLSLYTTNVLFFLGFYSKSIESPSSPIVNPGGISFSPSTFCFLTPSWSNSENLPKSSCFLFNDAALL
jgi:hypothetical protein